MYSTITGIGAELPGRKVGNDYFADYLDTSAKWIETRTGINTRYFAQPGTKIADVALPAAQRALAMAELKATQVEMIIFATATPDRIMPATACILQDLLGARDCPAVDVQAVCSGFIYGLDFADAMICAGRYSNVLVVGADLFSRVLDFQDRSTCILFGDGAGAAVVQASSKPGIAASNLHADGSLVDCITVKGYVAKDVVQGTGLFTMAGTTVFKQAIKAMEDSALAACSKAGVRYQGRYMAGRSSSKFTHC